MNSSRCFGPSCAPAPPAHFTGREAELAALVEALTAHRASQALVAVQGVAGVGKSALAAHLAAECASAFPGGVLWADLSASAGDPLPILASWARALGSDVSKWPYPGSRAQAVRGVMMRRFAERGRLLAVLDDVRRQWLEGVRVIGAACPPGVALLLTAQDLDMAQALGAQVQRLDLMPPEEAVALLTGLAGAPAARDLDATHRLAEQVGRLPLALALAGRLAALRGQEAGFRLAMLDAAVEAFAAEGAPFAGLRGLAACLSLSYEAQEPQVQRLFRALAAFAPAPIAPSRAAAVLEEEVETVQAGMEALASVSLVQAKMGDGEIRWSMHSLVRGFATSLLERAGEGRAVRAAHARHMLDYALSHSGSAAADYDALEAEHAQLLAGMNYARQERNWELVRRYAEALCLPSGGYLSARGYWGELQVRLAEAAEAARALGHRQEEATSVGKLAVLAQVEGRYEEAQQLHQQSLEISERRGDREGMAESLYQLGRVAQARGDAVDAQRLYRRSLEVAEELGDRAGAAATLYRLGGLAQLGGERAEARRLYRQSLEIYRALGDRQGVAATLHELADLAFLTGVYDEARRLYGQCLEVEEDLGERAGSARSLHQLGVLARRAGELDEAQRLVERSLEIERELERPAGMAQSLHELGNLAHLRGEVDEARRFYAQALGISEELGDRAGAARALGQLGELALLKGEVDEARRLYRKTLGVLEELGDQAGVSVALHQLGNLAYLTGDDTEAWRLYWRSLAIAEELGDRAGESRTLGQLAHLAEVRGDLVEAELNYQRSLSISQSLGDAATERMTLTNMARLFEGQGRLAEALLLLEQAVQIDRCVGFPELRRDVLALRRVRRQMQPGCVGWIARYVAALGRALAQLQGG
jgi:tetratricopeptide (TPR) repeat protein